MIFRMFQEMMTNVSEMKKPSFEILLSRFFISYSLKDKKNITKKHPKVSRVQNCTKTLCFLSFLFKYIDKTFFLKTKGRVK